MTPRRATCLAPTCLTEYLCVAPTSPSAADSASPKPRLARADASSSSTPSDSGSDSQGRTLIPRFNHGGHPEGGFGRHGGAKEYGGALVACQQPRAPRFASGLRGVVATRPVGGFRRREHPVSGMRPAARFALAIMLTAGWVAFAVWASGPWRDELDQAIGPVMAWVIPVLLAYIPGLVIGFMASTLIVSPYHGLERDPPVGPWPEGEWPPVTVVVAAWNEEEAIEATLERLAATTYPGRYRGRVGGQQLERPYGRAGRSRGSATWA